MTSLGAIALCRPMSSYLLLILSPCTPAIHFRICLRFQIWVSSLTRFAILLPIPLPIPLQPAAQPVRNPQVRVPPGSLERPAHSPAKVNESMISLERPSKCTIHAGMQELGLRKKHGRMEQPLKRSMRLAAEISTEATLEVHSPSEHN